MRYYTKDIYWCGIFSVISFNEDVPSYEMTEERLEEIYQKKLAEHIEDQRSYLGKNFDLNAAQQSFEQEYYKALHAAENCLSFNARDDLRFIALGCAPEGKKTMLDEVQHDCEIKFDLALLRSREDRNMLSVIDMLKLKEPSEWTISKLDIVEKTLTLEISYNAAPVAEELDIFSVLHEEKPYADRFIFDGVEILAKEPDFVGEECIFTEAYPCDSGCELHIMAGTGAPKYLTFRFNSVRKFRRDSGEELF